MTAHNQLSLNRLSYYLTTSLHIKVKDAQCRFHYINGAYELDIDVQYIFHGAQNNPAYVYTSTQTYPFSGIEMYNAIINAMIEFLTRASNRMKD